MGASSEEELLLFASRVLAAFGTTFGLQVDRMIGTGSPRVGSIEILLQPPFESSAYPFPLYGQTSRHVRHPGQDPEFQALLQMGTASVHLPDVRAQPAT